MNVDEVQQSMLNEAAKLIILQVYGFSTKVGARLAALLRRRDGELGTDRASIERQVLDVGRADPAWAREMAELLAEAAESQPPMNAAQPPDPYHDRVDVLASVPSNGVFVIAGRPGSGRTALVRKIIWDRRDQYPAGSLELDLRDFRQNTGELSVTDVQRSILSICGIGHADQPGDAAGLTMQFRSLMATRRMVLALHGVRGADEIRPFEPTSPLNLVLATTGRLGADLRASYKCVVLGPLEANAAWQMLAGKCGPDVLSADPASAWQLLDMCDYLPEPIQYVGGELTRIASQPGAARTVLTRLRSTGLAGAFDVVNAGLDATFADLGPAARGACVALARHPGYDFDQHSASALLGEDAWDRLAGLDDAGLIVRTVAGRQRLHNAVRGYVEGANPADGRAFGRLLAFLRDCAVHADFADSSERLRRYPHGWGETIPQVGERLADYLNRQRYVLLDLVRMAHQRGSHVEVCQLGGALEVLVNRYGGFEWYVALNDVVLASARVRLDERDTADRRAMLVRSHQMQGRMYTLLRVLDRAEVELTRASAVAEGLGGDDRQLQASLNQFWGRLYQERGELPAAADKLAAALRIDREIADGRAAMIDARMLANVYVEMGAFDQAGPLLDDAMRSTHAHGRNLARIYTVAAKAAIRSCDVAAAGRWLGETRTVLASDGATQYEWELAELEAELATVTGPVEHARALWGGLAQAAWRISHPKMYGYLARMERLSSPR